MKKDEFLSSRTRDLIEVFEEYGSYDPTFAILYDDGTTNSFATQFDGQQSKEAFEYFMRKMCSDPKVIACTFTSDGWISIKSKKENKREC